MISPAAVVATLLLHAALVAATVIGLSARTEKPSDPPAIVVQLVPQPVVETPASAPPVAEAAPPAPVPAPEPPPPLPAPPPPAPQKKRPEPKRTPAPAVKPRKAITPEVAQPEVPAPAVPPIVNNTPPSAAAPAAPPAQADPPAPPAPPVRTGVSIPASYAATNRKPGYPALSRRYAEQGTVVLRVLVKADGTAGNVEVRTSSGFPLLDESARTTVQTWRFNPATSDGKPVDEWFLVPIPFKLQN